MTGLRIDRSKDIATITLNRPTRSNCIDLPTASALGSDVEFRLGDVAIGLSPDAGATWLLQKLGGRRLAQELCLTGWPSGAAEAMAAGLVTQVVGLDLLMAEARAVAERLVEGSPVALAATKRLLNAAVTNDLAGQLDAESRSIAELGATATARAQIAAFLRRRQERRT